MNDTEIRLHCIEAADGNLSIAKQLYAWVKDTEEPRAGGVVHPIAPVKAAGSAAGLNVGIPVGFGQTS